MLLTMLPLRSGWKICSRNNSEMPSRFEIAPSATGPPLEFCAMSSIARTAYLPFVEICISGPRLKLHLYFIYPTEKVKFFPTKMLRIIKREVNRGIVRLILDWANQLQASDGP